MATVEQIGLVVVVPGVNQADRFRLHLNWCNGSESGGFSSIEKGRKYA